MDSAEEQLKRIQDKVQQLLKQHTALQKENAQLKAALSTAKDQTSLQQSDIDVLRQQVEVLKLGSGDMNAAEKKEFEKRINGYLKEIDRCIALLSE
ncbi:MAG TPA: hypothetical protein VFZ42_07725 [Chitinophagaceae bacterium]